ncbi:hypothetical protein WN55_05484 [Dufourea novaeangliae]|uniref:Uncharacterized protein n=1 Tax=Dufourea novaeangliae TaxID=178035 RepID=A0A154PMJ7_DUFNO|nr:hypothetical protein WN55_05484 [Dufourea novaeangliae]
MRFLMSSAATDVPPRHVCGFLGTAALSVPNSGTSLPSPRESLLINGAHTDGRQQNAARQRERAAGIRVHPVAYRAAVGRDVC